MRFSRSLRIFPVICAIGLAGAIGAQADTSYNFQVTGGNALLTVGNGYIKVTLTDLYVNPTSVAQNISAFWFTTSVTPTSPSIASSSAGTIDVASNGTYTNTGTVAPGWGLTLTGAVTKLDDLGYAGPDSTIIGAPGSGGIYTSGGSIDGNNPHNPFLNQTATWTLSETGITAATIISNVHFMFGTTENAGILATGTIVTTPEPATMAMFFGGFGLILLARKWRTRLPA